MLLHHIRNTACALGFALLGASATAQDPGNCCPDKPPIRPIDKTCLPAGRAKTVPLYRADLLAKYQEIANVDSFISDNNCTDTVRLQLQDLQKKGAFTGADALIRVRLLTNKVRGYQENPDTPFFDVRQGESEDYFYRATAIKYLEKPVGEPKTAAVVETLLPAKKTKEQVDTFGTGKLFSNSQGKKRRNAQPGVISTSPGSY
jgi:hypothetical protein